MTLLASPLSKASCKEGSTELKRHMLPIVRPSDAERRCFAGEVTLVRCCFSFGCLRQLTPENPGKTYLRQTVVTQSARPKIRAERG